VLRILQVVNIMDRAGLETMLMNYYRSIDRSQIQFDFLTHRHTEGAYEQEIISMGGRVYHAPRLYPQNYIAYFKYMDQFFKEHTEYQIVHSHIDTMSIFPLYAAKRRNVSIRISHSHSSKLDKDAKIAIKYLAKLALTKVANVYCACGERAGKFMYGNRTFRVIKNAVDLEKFKFNSELRMKTKEMLGIGNAFVIGHVGRYCYIKNQAFLMEVFYEVRKTITNVKLLLIGKGEDEAMLRIKAEELGCKDDVLFLIDRSDVDELYQAMDVFVMPSLFEGLPVVGIEAQANGLQCIVSNQISKEILLTNSIQMLSLSDTKEQWAETIIRIPRTRSNSCMEMLRKTGYDVHYEVDRMMEWYQSLDAQANSSITDK